MARLLGRVLRRRRGRLRRGRRGRCSGRGRRRRCWRWRRGGRRRGLAQGPVRLGCRRRLRAASCLFGGGLRGRRRSPAVVCWRGPRRCGLVAPLGRRRGQYRSGLRAGVGRRRRCPAVLPLLLLAHLCGALLRCSGRLFGAVVVVVRGEEIRWCAHRVYPFPLTGQMSKFSWGNQVPEGNRAVRSRTAMATANGSAGAKSDVAGSPSCGLTRIRPTWVLMTLTLTSV